MMIWTPAHPAAALGTRSRRIARVHRSRESPRGLGYPALVATCLVTGGAGFLGSHLCDELLARGNRVICVDNLETGSLANIEHIRDPERFVHLNVDIIEPYFVEEPIDFVYHLASPASPIDYLRLPLHTLKVGSYGTHHTLGLAKAKRARFLLASTSEVYGDPLEHPQPESYWGHVNPIGPRGVYDEAKRYAEALTMAYHRQQGVDTAIVRIFNTYGSRMRPHDGARDPDVPAPGARQPSDHGVRRRQPDALVLLRERPDPGDHRARRVRLPRPGEHRQPRRVHAAGTGRDGQGADRLDARRSSTRRCPRTTPSSASPNIALAQRAARLVAGGAAARGAAAHDRAVRRRAARGRRQSLRRSTRGTAAGPRANGSNRYHLRV